MISREHFRRCQQAAATGRIERHKQTRWVRIVLYCEHGEQIDALERATLPELMVLVESIHPEFPT